MSEKEWRKHGTVLRAADIISAAKAASVASYAAAYATALTFEVRFILEKDMALWQSNSDGSRSIAAPRKMMAEW